MANQLCHSDSFLHIASQSLSFLIHRAGVAFCWFGAELL